MVRLFDEESSCKAQLSSSPFQALEPNMFLYNRVVLMRAQYHIPESPQLRGL